MLGWIYIAHLSGVCIAFIVKYKNFTKKFYLNKLKFLLFNLDCCLNRVCINFIITYDKSI